MSANPAVTPTPLPQAPRTDIVLTGALVDVNAERALLGTLLLAGQRDTTNTTFKQVVVLDHTAFTVRSHQALFLAMKNLFEAGEAVTYHSVKGHLEATPLKKDPSRMAMELVGQEMLRELMLEEEGNVTQLLRLIQTAAERRRMDADADAMKQMARDTQMAPTRLMDQVSALMTQGLLRMGRLTQTPAQTLREGITLLNETYNTESEIRGEGWKTGIHALTEILGGFEPGHVHFFGGRPGAGKSIMLQRSAWAILEQGGRPFLQSIEMEERIYWQRLVSMVSALPLTRIKAKKLEDAELMHFNEVVERLINHRMADKFRVLYKKMPTLTELKTAFAVEYFERGADAYLLDYAGYRKIAFPEETRAHRPIIIPPTQKMAAIVAWLLEMAEDFHIPVIAAAQMTREFEKRGGVPMLGDIEQSSAVEHDAWFVGLLHEDKEQITGQDYGKTDLYVVKNRGGQNNGIVPMTSRKSISSFSDWGGL